MASWESAHAMLVRRSAHLTGVGGRVASYWIVGFGLAAVFLVARNSTWQSSAQLHTVMEAAATVLALVVGSMALARFYSKKNNTFLFIGAAFLGTSFLDGFHAVVTSEFFSPLLPSDLPSLIPWSWVASRLFLSLLLFLSWAAWTRERRLGPSGRVSEGIVYAFVAALTLASFGFFAFVPLPRAYYPEIPFHRPEEFLPALFFLMTLIGYLRKGAWRHDSFEHWLVLSLIVGIIGQAVFMSGSGQVFDVGFDLAHILKNVSYIFVLTGLLLSMLSIFRETEKANFALRENEQRFRDFAQSASDGFWEMDSNLQYTDVWGRIVKGVREEGREPIGKTRWDHIGADPDKDEIWRRHKEDLEARRPFRDFEYSYVNSRGRQHRRASGRPIFDAGGSFIGYRGIVENRTAATEAEWEARRVQERLEYAVNQMPLGIALYDAEDRLVIRNNVARDFRSIADQVRPGIRFEDLVRAGVAADLTPEALGREEEYIRERLERHRNPTEPFEQLRRGRRLEIREHKLPDGGTIVIQADVTEERQAKDALRATEARLAAMLEIAPDGVIALDAEKKIRVFNHGAEQIFGYEAAEVIDSSVEILLPEDKREIHRQQIDAFSEHSQNSRLASKRPEIIGQRKDGSQFSAEASISKLNVFGETMFMAMLHDITDRKLADEAILEAKESAELANRAKSEFLANMSHELRTPLNAINGFSQAMLSGIGGALTEKQLEYVNDIYSSGNHLLDLINDVLNLSKIELGEMEVRDDQVDLVSCVNSCVQMFNERRHETRLEIAVAGFIELPLIRADTRKVRQMLLNLLSNALKFTGRDGAITVDGGLTNEGAVFFQVSDTGIGMSHEEIEVALSLFGQVESGMDRNIEGTGLGLPLCKSLVEAHGGSLEIESEPGVGSKVRVLFPPERVLHGLQRVS